MQLTLRKHAQRRVYGQVSRRAQAHFIAPFLEIALGHHQLLPHDRFAVGAGPIRAGTVHAVVELGVVAVVVNRGGRPLQEGTRVRQIEVADLSLDSQRRLHESVIGTLWAEVGDLKVAAPRVVTKEAAGAHRLTHNGGRHRPVVVEIDFERHSPALGLDGVVVVLDVRGIADSAGTHRSDGRTRRHVCGTRNRRVIPGAGGLAGPGWKRAHAVLDARVLVGSRDVVDVAGIVLVPANEADRRKGRQRYVDKDLRLPARTAVIHAVALDIGTGRKLAGVRLVGDDADRTGFGTR